MAIGDQPPFDTLSSSPPVAWSFSPARLNAVGRPAVPAAGPSPLALLWSEKTQLAGTPDRAARSRPFPGAGLRHALSQDSSAVSSETGGTPGFYKSFVRVHAVGGMLNWPAGPVSGLGPWSPLFPGCCRSE